MSAVERLLRGRVGRDPLATLFPKQLAAANDPNLRIALLCGRRSGKTQAFLRKAVRVMQLYPGCRIPYIALTRQSAKGILWREALKLNEQLGLGLVPRESDLSLTAPNGSQIFLLGANKSDEVEKLRGQAFPLVGVDEAASFRATLLEYLLNDVLRYSLLDLNGALWLLGTPGAACVGYFHEITRQGTGKHKGWSVHHWTALDNPHLPHARQWIEQEMSEHGWTWETPTVRREFLGEWVRDDSALVYKFHRDVHMVERLPDDYYLGGHGWFHVIGKDYGVVDATAWVVWAGNSRDKQLWAVEAGKQSGWSPSEDAEHSKKLVDTYNPQVFVGDSGGLGKAFVTETRRRFGIQIASADKTQKLAHVELFNDDLRCRPPRAYLVKGKTEAYAEELELLQWDLSSVQVKVGGIIRHEERKAEDPRFENHCCDAGLYGNRASKSYLNEPTVRRPVDPSTDAFERDAENEWQPKTQPAQWWDRD